MGKNYYWLKLHDDFFTSKRMKKLRRLAGGDTYTIIYLKMQLLAMKHDGYLNFSGIEETPEAELALDLDESPDDIRMTLIFLKNCGLAETTDDENFFLPYAVENTGSETAAAGRMRKLREKQKKALECNNVTPQLRDRYVEIEIDKEIENRDRVRGCKAHPPTIDEVSAYCAERGNKVDAEHFYNYYSSQGWKKANGRPLVDWKAAVVTWEKKEADYGHSRDSKAEQKPTKEFHIKYDNED